MDSQKPTPESPISQTIPSLPNPERLTLYSRRATPRGGGLFEAIGVLLIVAVAVALVAAAVTIYRTN